MKRIESKLRIPVLVLFGLALGFSAAVFPPMGHASTGLKPAAGGGSGGGGGGAVSSVTGSSGVSCSPTTGSVVCSASAVPLSALASQAATTIVGNSTGGSASPTALTALPQAVFKSTLTGVTGAGSSGYLAVAADGTPSVGAGTGGGGLTFVQRQSIGADTNDITFNTGISGNTDERYKLVVYGISGAGVAVGSGLKLQFNGGDLSGYVTNTAGGTSGGNTSWLGGTGLGVAASGAAAAGDPYFTEFEIMAKSGNQRTILYRHARLSTSVANNRTIDNGMIYWTDTSTNITSISIHSSVNVFGAGTIAYLYKYQVN